MLDNSNGINETLSKPQVYYEDIKKCVRIQCRCSTYTNAQHRKPISVKRMEWGKIEGGWCDNEIKVEGEFNLEKKGKICFQTPYKNKRNFTMDLC